MAQERTKDIYATMDEALAMLDGSLKALKDNRNTHPDAYMSRRQRRDMSGNEAELAELRRLSPATKTFLNHHLRNIANSIICYCSLGKTKEAQTSALQLVDFLQALAPAVVYHKPDEEEA